jgi:hypothetical protein
MLEWVVTFRPALRRGCLLHSPKSLRLNLFADPHSLTPFPSIFYKKGGGEGVTSDVHTFGPSDWQMLLSHLDATPLSIHVSVDSKWFTGNPSPLDATLTKNTGVGVSERSAFNLQTSNVPSVPLQPTAFGATIPKDTRFLHHPGKQLRSPRCLTIGERTSGTVHRRSRSQVVPRSSVLTQKGILKPRTLTLDRSREARATLLCKTEG